MFTKRSLALRYARGWRFLREVAAIAPRSTAEGTTTPALKPHGNASVNRKSRVRGEAESHSCIVAVEGMVALFLYDPRSTSLMAVPVRRVELNAFGPPGRREVNPLIEDAAMCTENCTRLDNFVSLASVAEVGVSIGSVPPGSVPPAIYQKANQVVAKNRMKKRRRWLTPGLTVMSD